jgi:hypothetical protein
MKEKIRDSTHISKGVDDMKWSFDRVCCAFPVMPQLCEGLQEPQGARTVGWDWRRVPLRDSTSSDVSSVMLQILDKEIVSRIEHFRIFDIVCVRCAVVHDDCPELAVLEESGGAQKGVA